MSDLQCPATLVLVAAEPGDEQWLADLLADRHVALVYADLTDGAAQTGAALARQLGVACQDVPGAAGSPDLQTVADLHRGETVVVVGDASSSHFTLPVEVSVDGAGFSPRRWPPA